MTDGHIWCGVIVIKPKLAGQTPDNMEYWVDVQKHDARAFKVYTKRAAKELKAEVQVEDLSNVMKPFAIQSRFKFPEEGPKGHFYGPFQDEV